MPDIRMDLYSDPQTRLTPEMYAITHRDVTRERIEQAADVLADVVLDGAHAA